MALGNLDKAGDIGPGKIIALPAIGRGSIKAGAVNALHDRLQAALSTSSRDQLNRMESWAISSPDTATPPALVALAGPKRMP